MFGGKKKTERPKRTNPGLGQYGLFDIPSNFDTGLGNVDDDDQGDDSDLEAELAALAGGGGGGAKPKRPARKPLPQSQLDTMVAASMRDIGSDEELSGDDDDPDLLNELKEIAGGDTEEPEEEIQSQPASKSQESDMTSLLTERLKMYELVEQNAKANGETGKARRYGRAIKSLHDLIKQSKTGHVVNPEDIPPEVRILQKKSDDSQPELPVAVRPAPPVPSPKPHPESDSTPRPPAENKPSQFKQIDNELLSMLTDRRNQYKVAALKAKKEGNTSVAVKYVKIAKQFEAVMHAVENGQPVDLSLMPGPPEDTTPTPQLEQAEMQKNADPSEPTVPSAEEEVPQPSLITASTVAEALEQRLAVYKAQVEAAKEQNNAGKARRLGRIIKQFEDAIKLNNAGKPIPVDELPTPPGYGPIPVGDAPASTPAPKPTPIPKPSPPKPNSVSESGSSDRSSVPSPTQSSRVSGNHVPTSRAEKQVVILLAKQKQFKEAALNAKRKGEISQAKEFLRQAKGFDKLIDAARAGLPVDFSSIPVSPEAKSQLDNEYDIVMAEECTEEDSTDKDILKRLENQLMKQMKMCLTTRDHHKALGDVAGTNRFERLALEVTKDLDIVRLAERTPGAAIPKFHYETKNFSIVKSFTDINENEVELTIFRGISYTFGNSKEIDTFVKFEFPFPQDEPFGDRTVTVKDTNNPEYNATFTIPIQRTSRVCQRVFKRGAVKLEVYSKGGWFRGDTLLGTATVKLQPLETQCEIHDSFDVSEGRKKVGGKLEVRVRLRHPIVTQQVEQIQERWLVFDS